MGVQADHPPYLTIASGSDIRYTEADMVVCRHDRLLDGSGDSLLHSCKNLGGPEFLQQCYLPLQSDKYQVPYRCSVGHVHVTPATGNIPAKHVCHAVAPSLFRHPTHLQYRNTRWLLRQMWQSIFEAATAHNVRHVLTSFVAYSNPLTFEDFHDCMWRSVYFLISAIPPISWKFPSSPNQKGNRFGAPFIWVIQFNTSWKFIGKIAHRLTMSSDRVCSRSSVHAIHRTMSWMTKWMIRSFLEVLTPVIGRFTPIHFTRLRLI